MSLRKLLPVALLLAVISIRCAGSPAEPIGTVSITQTTTTTTTSVIPGVNAGAVTSSPGGTGVASATLYTFGPATPPSGGVPPYTVTWAFGDGAAGAGSIATHVYPAPGTFTATATVADSRGVSAQATTTVSVRSVTGQWKIRFNNGLGDEAVDLVQAGAAITATVNDTNNLFGLGAGAGTVSNPRAIAVNLTFGAGTPTAFAASLIGSVDATVTEWNGFASGYPGGGTDFKAIRNSAPGVLGTPQR
jgi:PKD domain-containing protein